MDDVGEQRYLDCMVGSIRVESFGTELLNADLRNSITDQVVTTLNTQKAAKPNYKIVVTGHSLGGALASIASASLVGLGNNITAYTLGQFRTGDPNYANYIDSILPQRKMYRITHASDGVPQTISIAKGYRHHSTEYWELDPASAANTRQCSGQEPPVRLRRCSTCSV